MPRRLLYATTNPGKLMEIRAILEPHGLPVLAPADLGLALDVAETGVSLAANAALKADAYRAAAGPDVVVLGDDTGMEIDALGGAPGIHVRRWRDGRTRMSDEAIIAYALEQLRGVPPDQRGAQFRTVFALAAPGYEMAFYDGTLRGVILEAPDPLRIDGFPFESIFYVPEWDMLLGHAHQLPAADRAGLVTHRARALHAALPALRAMLAG